MSTARINSGFEGDLARVLLESLRDCAGFAMDVQGRVLSWSAPAEHLLGYREDEVIGQAAARFYTPDDFAAGVPAQELHQARHEGRVEADRWYLRKDGSRFWGTGVTTALRGADGALHGFAKVIREHNHGKRIDDARTDAIEDVPERRRAEPGRQQIETPFTSLHRALFESIDEGVVLLERMPLRPDGLRDYRYITMNPAMQALFGIPDLSGQSMRDHFPDESEHWYDDYDRVLESGRPIRFQRECVPRGRVLDTYLARIEDDTGNRLLAVMRDVSARKRSDDALRRSEEQFRALVQASSDVVYRMTPDWTEMRHVMGRDFIADSDAPSPTWLERYIHPDDQPQVRAAIDEAVRTKSMFELVHRVLRPDGSLGWTFSRALPVLDGSGAIVEWLGTARDITDRKQAEEALRESEEQYRQLVQSANSAIIRWRRDGTISFFNEYAERFFGWPAREAIGRHVGILIPEADGNGANLTTLVEDVVRHPERYVSNIHENVRRDGRRVWMMWANRAIRNASGEVTELLAIGNDITEQKRAEEALQEANRRKDAFLATLAHELRNPLAPIRAGLDMLRMRPGDAAVSEELLRIMHRQLSHLARLVDDLLDVSRISRGKVRLRRERFDLAEIIDAALDMNSSGLGRRDRRLALSVPSAPLPVEGDRVRLVQVVSNLLNNAVRFTDAEGHIALSVVPSGDRAEIRVQDDGRGIPPDRLTDIFEMFFQVESGRGGALGIGLTLVQSLVALHGGTVHAESEGPGHGAAFVVSLPLSPGAPPPPKPRWEAPAETPAMTQRRVLVVDDNRDIADSLRLLLTMLKAEVRVAYDGAESIRICRDWEPTHVLMDLGMPGMDGFEAARRLRADHPDRAFRLIAVSGWGREEDRRQSRRAGFDQHLVKPVGIAELKALLSE